MFGGRLLRSPDEDQKDIFAPVSDLMVGVVFIFIILILALSLDLSSETTVPRSAYDAKVSENVDLARRLKEAQDALKASQDALKAAEKQVDSLSAKRRSSWSSCASLRTAVSFR